MKKLLRIAALSTVCLIWSGQLAQAHNVWCHCPDRDPLKTVEFFHHAGAVYEAFAEAVKIWHTANEPLEAGVLAEFEYKAGMSDRLRPDLFRETLVHMTKLDAQFGILRMRLERADTFDHETVAPAVGKFSPPHIRLIACLLRNNIFMLWFGYLFVIYTDRCTGFTVPVTFPWPAPIPLHLIKRIDHCHLHTYSWNVGQALGCFQFIFNQYSAIAENCIFAYKEDRI